ncbi:MAG TPA: energy transducer TonB, partial [Rhodanobacter sp.]
MSSASLAVAARPHPDAARVAALSAAIALNLAALLILTRPLAPQALALAHKLATVPQIVLIEPPPPVPQPPPIELKPLPHPPPMPVHVQPRPEVAPPAAMPSTEGTQPMPLAAPPSAAPDDA